MNLNKTQISCKTLVYPLCQTQADLTFLLPSVLYKCADDKGSRMKESRIWKVWKGVRMIKGRIKERWRRLAGADMSQNKHPENRTFSRRQKWAGLFHRALSESMPPTLRHPFLLQNNILMHNLRGNTASNWLFLVCIITGNTNRTVVTSFSCLTFDGAN